MRTRLSLRSTSVIESLLERDMMMELSVVFVFKLLIVLGIEEMWEGGGVVCEKQ